MDDRQKKLAIIIGSIIGVVVIVLIGSVIYYFTQTSKDAELVPEQNNAPEAMQQTPQPTIEPAPEPTKDPHAGLVQSSISGKWVKKSVENKRPVAIMINNIEYAFERQYGVSKADIVYEALAEGGITRMMAIYQDVSKVKRIGSVRSARHYYVQFAYEWDAIFCHFGQTKYAIAKMEQLNTQNLSGLSAIGPVVYARDNSISAPHNVFTNGKKIKKGAKKLKYSLKKRKGKQAEHFDFYEKSTDLDSKKKAKNITLPYSYYSTVKMKYNAKKKRYMKFEYGKKHMDRAYKKQLSFKNVIVQFVKEKNKDHNGYQTMDISNNTGKGYYFTNGKYIPITWERKSTGKSVKMVYYTKDGSTLTINPGKTYIGVYPKNRKKLISIK